MVLGKTIYGYNYEVLLHKGVILTGAYIRLLKNRGFIKIYIEDEETADIVLNDPISDKIRIMSTQDILKTYKVTQASMIKIELDTSEAITRAINTSKIKRSFQESPVFKQLCDNIHYFLDEIMNHDILSCLNSIKSVDNYTYEHSLDTAVISTLIAKRLYLNEKKLIQIAIGEFLHDIGKIFIDNKILNKPGKLTPEEFDLVKQHTTYGYELLKDVKSIDTSSAHIPYQHHERQDGKGYPRGLEGTNKLNNGDVAYAGQDKMIMIAEIASLADFYDACSSDRPYRPGLPPDVVYELVKDGAGSQFNKELVDFFLSVVPKYPVGFEVRIKSGEYKDFTGIIAELNKHDLPKPKVRLLCNHKKIKIDPIDIDLSAQGVTAELECVC